MRRLHFLATTTSCALGFLAAACAVRNEPVSSPTNTPIVPRAAQAPHESVDVRHVRIVVRAGRDHAPIADALIAREEAEDPGRGVRTDESGAAALGFDETETFYLVTARGFSGMETVLPAANDVHEDLVGEVLLRRGVPARGRVVDSKTGAPIDGARVAATVHPNVSGPNAVVGIARSARDGRFEIVGVPDWAGEVLYDEIRFVVTASGHVDREVDRTPSEKSKPLDVGDVALDPER